MPLIVGLGNPGKKYVGSRHNIGFELINKLADSFSLNLGPGKGPFYIAKTKWMNQQILLVKPSTYMNNSGDAVQQALHWFKLQPKDCLVCYDDLHLDLGMLRLRPDGSAGGHNGIKDIIQKTGTNQFPRLRIGIGNDFRDGQQVQHVLSSFDTKQREIIDIAIEKAADAVKTFVTEGINNAMNNFN